MQSSDFVKGVSGWRIVDGRIELYGGLAPIILEKTPEPEQPFVVVDGVAYISEASIKDGSIGKTRITNSVSVRFGAGGSSSSQFLLDADKFQVNERIDSVKEEVERLKLEQHADVVNLDMAQRLLSERLDSLAKKLNELHTLLGETKDRVKREIAETVLQDLERDKSGVVLGTFRAAFPSADPQVLG